MSDDDFYPQRENDVRDFNEFRVHWEMCARCGNTGWYVCDNLECKTTHILPSVISSHRCGCKPSGGDIAKKQRAHLRSLGMI